MSHPPLCISDIYSDKPSPVHRSEIVACTGKMAEKKIIRVGSRKSQLALWQTHHVVNLLKKAHADVECEIVQMTTFGDNNLDKALSKLGEKALFTRELETALETKAVDFVVHSLKDLPTTLPPGMVIGAIIERDSPYDAVVMHPKYKGETLKTLPEGSVIGTSSLRREAQLKRKYPALQFESVRGNLNTRLKKLDDDNKYAALILAAAGLQRLEWNERISQILYEDDCLYAVSQGAMAVEIRDNDPEMLRLIEPICHTETLLTCVAERSFMKTLEGGCSVPVAVSTVLEGTKMTMKGGVYNLDGSEAVEDSVAMTMCDPEEPTSKKPAMKNGIEFSSVVSHHISHDAMRQAEDLGKELAEKLVKQGAGEILRVVKALAKKAIEEDHAKKMAKLEEEERNKEGTELKS